MANVRKGYVGVPYGEVHFRYAGRGPLVVLLHDAPRSSLEHVPTLEWLGDQFTVVAIDAPGYGNSTPLPLERPAVADFVAALDQALAALGIDRFALYGLRAGARIALQYAADHPQHCALTILEGLPPNAFAQPAESLRGEFVPPVHASPDGAHLAHLWSRALDDQRHAPWLQRRGRNRLPLDLPDDRHLHEYATDAFSSGAGWFGAYGAALHHDSVPAIARLATPAVLLASEGDALLKAPDASSVPLPGGLRVRRLPPGLPAWRQCISDTLKGAGLADRDWSPPKPEVVTQAPRHHYVGHLAGQLHVRVQGVARGMPRVLLLPDVPGSSRQVDALATALASDRIVMVPDLPGLGDSDPLPSPTLGSYVALLDECIEALQPGPVDVVAEGLGTAFALALAANRPSRVRRVIVDGVPIVRSRDRRRFVRLYCPPAQPDRAGAYLHRLWDQLRSMETNWPWFERSATGVRAREATIDAAALQAALVAVMKQLDAYGDAARAALDAAVRDISKAVGQPVLVLKDGEDCRYAGTASLMPRLAQGRLLARPAALEARVTAFREFLA